MGRPIDVGVEVGNWHEGVKRVATCGGHGAVGGCRPMQVETEVLTEFFLFEDVVE